MRRLGRRLWLGLLFGDGLAFIRGPRLRTRPPTPRTVIRGRARCLACFLFVALAGEARGQLARSAKDPGQPAQVRDLLKQGGRAVARRDWNEAARDFGEALKLAPEDARLREELRRVLERRARAREALAVHPPPPPIGFSDRPQDPGLVTVCKDLRWKAQLKREALEARIDAESARPNPDQKEIAKLRREAAAQKTEEDRLSTAIADENKKAAESEVEREKAFAGMRGIGPTR